MEDHMITPAAHQSQDEHMTTEKQMEEKKYLLLPNITNERKQKGPQNRQILGERSNCPTPKHSHLATLESGKSAVLIDAAKTFYCSLKADILNFIH